MENLANVFIHNLFSIMFYILSPNFVSKKYVEKMPKMHIIVEPRFI